MKRSRLHLMVVGAGLASVAACTSVGVVGYPGEYVATRTPAHVWVTRAGASNMLDLYNPQLHGDTLAGFDKSGGYLEMPIGDVQLMRAPMAAPGRTALLAATAAVGTALVITHIQGNSQNCLSYPPGGLNQGLPVPCGTEYGKPN